MGGIYMNKKHIYNGNFFPPDPNDPVYNILAAGGNMVVGYGLKWASRKIAGVMGLSEVSAEKQIALNRSRLVLQKQEADFEATKLAREKQSRIVDLKIEQKELEIAERRQRLETAEAQKTQLTVPTVMEVISGALEVTANPDGLIGSPEQPEGYALWLDSFEDGKVILVLGRRGSGKTALAGKLGEFMMATHKMPVYWIGLPEQARSLLPSWIHMVSSPDQCPVGCLIIIDEGGIHFLSLAFATDQNRLLRALLMVCRQRHSSLVVAVQSSRDLEYSVVRQADSIIFREPGMHQPDSERPDIRSMAKKAAAVFKDIPKDEKRESAFVFDDNFTGIIRCSLPSFWSEDLSHVYAHFDLAGMQQQVVKNQQLQKVVVQETKLLDAASLDKRILELRRQGYGIERIAKTLNVSTYAVRKVLPKEY
jgi:energy-coupling factor transporter ATP-binding protein EcfA2